MSGVKQSPVGAFTEIQDPARRLNEMRIKMERIAIVSQIVTGGQMRGSVGHLVSGGEIFVGFQGFLLGLFKGG